MKRYLLAVVFVMTGCGQAPDSKTMQARIDSYSQAERYLYNIEQIRNCANASQARQVAIVRVLNDPDVTADVWRVFAPLEETARAVLDFSEADQAVALSRANNEIRDACFADARLTYEQLHEGKLISSPD